MSCKYNNCKVCGYKKDCKIYKDCEELKRRNKQILKYTLIDLENRDKQIHKAKEIIKKFSEFANNEIEYDPEHPQKHTDLWNKLCEKAEQFLNSEVVK